MSSSDRLPSAFQELLQSRHVTPQTKAALEARLAHQPVTIAACFNEVQFRTLAAVCARLIPQPEGAQALDLPGLLDEQLKSGAGKGWRYDVMPPDAETFRNGMDELDYTAQALYGNLFHSLNAAQQDELLRTIQAGGVSEGLWRRVPAQRFFEELLAALCGIYYSQPSVKAAIGDVSFADIPGWTAIGLNEQDSREPYDAHQR